MIGRIAKALLPGTLIVAIAKIGRGRPAMAASVASLSMFLPMPAPFRGGCRI